MNTEALNTSQIINKAAKPEFAATARVIAISSGKGGVGKSSITLNLAVELSRQGKRVCIFDADTNLANINIMTGLSPEYTLLDLVKGDKALHEIMLKGPAGISIIPAASGVLDFVSFDENQQQYLQQAISELEQDFDVILIDTAAGINDSVLGFVQAAGELIIGITAEPTSLTDAFSLLKVLKKQGFDKPLRVLVNKATGFDAARDTLTRFSGAIKKYLDLKITHPGYILEDRNVPRSVMVQRPYVLMYPKSPASRCLRHFAERLLQQGKGASHFSEWLKSLQGQGDHLDVDGQEVSNEKAENKEKESTQWLEQAFLAIENEPIDLVQQQLKELADIWLKRLQQEQKDTETFNQNVYQSAIYFASLLDERFNPQ